MQARWDQPCLPIQTKTSSKTQKFIISKKSFIAVPNPIHTASSKIWSKSSMHFYSRVVHWHFIYGQVFKASTFQAFPHYQQLSLIAPGHIDTQLHIFLNRIALPF